MSPLTPSALKKSVERLAVWDMGLASCFSLFLPHRRSGRRGGLAAIAAGKVFSALWESG